MTSRPLPPGRRGKSIRSASALQLTEEVKLLDVQDKPVVQPVIPELPVKQVLASIPPTIVEQPVAYVSAASAVQDQKPEETTSAHLEESPALPKPVKHFVTNTPTPVTTEPTATHEDSIVAPVASIAPTVDVAAPVPAPLIPIAAAPSAPLAATVPATKMDVEMPNLSEEYHPFQLLLPIDGVPTVPDSIECIYDDAAVQMQKNVLKVIKTLFKKDRSKLEDFKINSRLFGNDFMDSEEYLDSLVKDLGGVRALQFVPCLLSIQPDEMKRNSLLLSARTYRLRNLATLELQVKALSQQAPPVPAARKSQPVVPETPKAAEEKPQTTNSPQAVETPAPVVLQDVKVVSEPLPTPASAPVASVPAVEASPALLTAAVAHSVEVVETESSPAQAPVTIVGPASTPEVVQPVESASVGEQEPLTIPTLSSVIAEEKPMLTSLPPVQAVEAVSVAVEPAPTPAPAPVAVEEPMQMPDDDFMAHMPPEFRQAFLSDFQEKQVTKPSIIKVDIQATPVPPPVIGPLQPIAPIGLNEVTFTEVESTPDRVTFSVEVHSTEAEPMAVQVITSEASPLVASSSHEPEKNGLTESSKKREVPDQAQTNSVASAAHSVNLFGEPLSGDESFDEDENLFGETIAPALASKSEAPTQSSAPTAATSVVKPSQPLLFGYATAGADDSDFDSDDSDFSD